MKWREWKEPDGTQKVCIEITLTDQLRAKLQNWDHLLLRECEKSTSIADKVLGLEMITRRIEESER